MAQFGSDLFTGVDETKLTLTTSTSGHQWKVSGVGVSAPSSEPSIYQNKLSPRSSNGEHVVFYLDVVPASADYSVTVDVTYNGATTDLSGPAIRLAASSVVGSSFGYALMLSPQAGGFRLRRYDGSSPATLQTVNFTPVSGETYRMTAEGDGSTIKGRVQRLSDNQWIKSDGTWQAGQIDACSTTDATYAAAGRPGVSTYGQTPFTTIDNYSANDASAGDVTAPVLTSPTGAGTGTTTATGGATTDEANGTLYTVWTTAATTPTATQVEAGQNAAGTAAAASANTAVSSTGAKTNNATGLTASTTYYAHSMHKDAAGNRSNVVTSASFTTSAGGDVTAPVLTSPVGTQTGTSTATVGATTDEGNGTLYAVVTTSATAPSATQVMAGQTNTGAAAPWAGNVAVSSTGAKTLGATGLTASTAYYAHLMHRDAAGNNSAVVSSASFTTAAPVTATLNFQAAGMEFGSRTGLGISTFGLENGKSYRYTVHADGLTLGAAILTSAAITLDSAGKFPNLTSSSLTAGTTYIVCAVRQSDGAAAIFKMVAA